MRETVEARRNRDGTLRRCMTPSGPGWMLPQGVDVTWTPCHFGGRRPWLLCPCCQRRALWVYPIRGRLLCRRCAGLAYQVQQVPKLCRLQLAQERIRRRLGGTGEPCESFPEKPPRMHWRTYLRLRERHDELQAAEWEDFARQIDRLTASVHALARRR